MLKWSVRVLLLVSVFGCVASRGLELLVPAWESGKFLRDSSWRSEEKIHGVRWGSTQKEVCSLVDCNACSTIADGVECQHDVDGRPFALAYLFVNDRLAEIDMVPDVIQSPRGEFVGLGGILKIRYGRPAVETDRDKTIRENAEKQAALAQVAYGFASAGNAMGHQSNVAATIENEGAQTRIQSQYLADANAPEWWGLMQWDGRETAIQLTAYDNSKMQTAVIVYASTQIGSLMAEVRAQRAWKENVERSKRF